MIIKIARKELKSLFASPMGWIILALLQFVFGTFFLIGVDQYFQTMSGMIRPEQRLGVTEFVGHNVFSSLHSSCCSPCRCFPCGSLARSAASRR